VAFLARSRRANHFEAGGFVRSNEDVDYPNLMFHFLPIAGPLRRQRRP
jgi:choline dehydrogenase